MTYKEFLEWCSYRACDGFWSMRTAMMCTDIIRNIQSKPFWKRRKAWKEVEHNVVTCIVEPINKKIENARKVWDLEEGN